MDELNFPADPAELSAVEALRSFRSGALAPSELLDAQFRRIDVDAGRAPQQRINAVIQVLDTARTQAQRADEQYRAGVEGPLGAGPQPLLGLSVATKEKHGLAGEPLSEGLTARSEEVATEDHPLVERIRGAGGVIHARTASPEFSCATVTHSPLWGVTRNPFDARMSPGGSSGGAGAALAAGLTTLATASDIAGSTRVPAAFTGQVGYKAPYGRVPGKAPLSLDWYRGDGPMAHTVEDVALFYRVMAGIDPRDHSTVPGENVPIEYPQGADWFAGRRIGFSARLGDYPIHADVADSFDDTLNALAGAGAELVEVHLPWTSEQLREVSMAHFGHLLVPRMRELTTGHQVLADYTRRFMADAEEAASQLTFQETIVAEAALQAQLAEKMAELDVIITPVSAVPGLTAQGNYLDGLDTEGPEGAVHLRHYWQGHMTVPFNVCNRCPVMSTPACPTPQGMPLGVQWVGRPYDETTVFRAAAAWQELRPWSWIAPTHSSAASASDTA